MSNQQTGQTPAGRADDIDVVLCDLDGVVWLAHEPIEGSVAAVARLRDSGRRVLFVTNNSSALIGDHEAALAAIGIAADGDVISSAAAASTLVGAGERVMFGGGPGVAEAIRAVGAVAVEPDRSALDEGVDAVVVGIDRRFDYERLSALSAAVRAGARFVATNDDATYPTPAGLEPGGGAIVAAVATAAGAEPLVAGKPHRPMMVAVAERLGGLNPARTVMVGDRISTDGAFARAIGCRFALVRSGVTAPTEAADAAPDCDVANLARFADLIV